jgi:hypothetical protein
MFCTPGFWGPKGPGTLTSRGLPVLHQPGKIICLGLLWFATRNLAYPNIKKIAGQFLTPSCNMGLMQASHLVNLALMLYRLWTMTLLLSAITGIHIKDRKAIEIFSYCYVYGFSRLIFKKKLLKFLLLKMMDLYLSGNLMQLLRIWPLLVLVFEIDSYYFWLALMKTEHHLFLTIELLNHN